MAGRANVLRRPLATHAARPALRRGALVAGVLFQALLRDPLATPYTLGVSSGASLGAVIAICLGRKHSPACLRSGWRH